MDANTLIDVATDKAGSIGELATLLGKHRNRLAEWKKGNGEPSATDIARMARLVGLPILRTLAQVEARLHPEHRDTWQRALREIPASQDAGNGPGR